MKWLLNRLSEPSSHAGIAGLLSGIAAIASGNYLLGVPAVLTGLAAIVTPEKGSQNTL